MENSFVSNYRIAELDGLRGLSVSLVVLYHFFSRFAPPVQEENFYPYEPSANVIISNGSFGVQIFFMLSGFVIFNTLRRSTSSASFFAYRYFRLIPAMVVCAVLTFFIVPRLDNEGNLFPLPNAWSFLPSLTFIAPEIWNVILDRNDIQWIDGAYWSLWAEVIFYTVAGICFFVLRNRFVSCWLIFTVLVQGIRIISSPHLRQYFPFYFDSLLEKIYSNLFLLNFHFWTYFTLGIYFSALFHHVTLKRIDHVVVSVLAAYELYFLKSLTLAAMYTSVNFIFLLLIYKPRYVRWLQLKPLVWLGTISYPLYLIHENVGIALINRFSDLVGKNFNELAALFVIVLLIGLSYLIFKFLERPFFNLIKGFDKK